MNHIDRTCRLCQKKLVGRADKKFCDDACRNEFNNQLNSDINNMMRRVNNHLRKNRRILLELSEKGMRKVSRLELLALGFSFEYCTKADWPTDGSPVSYCYDAGLVQESEHQYKILTSQHIGTGNVRKSWIIQRTG